MESNVAKPVKKSGWPTLFDRKWRENFFDTPVDEFFNFGKVMNVPAVNVHENDKEFQLSIAAPGLEKQDFKVELADELLTISAEKEKEEKEIKEGRFNRREYNYNSWTRSFSIPENCDPAGIIAEYKNGELKILLPKTEVKQKQNVKTIAVK